VAAGQAVYMEHRTACHGENLEGEPDWRQHKPDGTLAGREIWAVLAYIKSRWPAEIRAAQARRTRAAQQ